MNMKKILQKKQYFSSEWDLVEIEKFANKCGISDTDNPEHAAAFMRITSDLNITKKLYKGNLVIGIKCKAIPTIQNFGCRLQIIMQAPDGKKYLVEDKQFRVNEEVSLEEFIYGSEKNTIYMTENGIKYRFKGVYAESEKITAEYYEAGWQAHSIKIKANCLTNIFKKYRDYDLLTYLLSGQRNGMQNDAFFDVSHCENAA